ncbi:protein of unknown function [Taphrina deformans PYCC 5710]|uniref:Uncharacterized protein n=1 Tax=Taphrina deformans (strain PYCC 5710 / ATCC 11124 / CBS 356.35 / IMI 108563 / JCM 9778 / NBRC 8474) TaxID=1097556 RepID=R4XAJ0_TAPDE|nr:protein of unknown function [Taphrina deformans PYCC 5710]|eukprot:CCG82844.1 protein of unknown function [Taphrina deformans PYCC 5710]
MESVTDTQGCAVYEEQHNNGQPAYRSRLRYKTYTPVFFENHKDIEIETDLLDLSPRMSHSTTKFPDSTVDVSRIDLPTMQYSAGQATHPGNDPAFILTSSGGYSAQLQVPQQQSIWSPLPSPHRSPASPGPRLYHDTESVRAQLFDQRMPISYSNLTPSSYPSFSYNHPDPPQGDSSQLHHIRPQIVIDNLSGTATHAAVSPTATNMYGSALLSPDSSSGFPTTSPMAHQYTVPGTSMHLAVPPTMPSRTRRWTSASENDLRSRLSPSSLKWAEHFGGRGPSSASSVLDFAENDDVLATLRPENVPQELLDYSRTLVPYHAGEDEACLRHYYQTLVGQICYPDRGLNNPFRLLLTTLCPREPALLHAVIAYAATDMAHNDMHTESIGRFSRAAKHYDAGLTVLSAQLDDVRHEQSIAALATAFFLDLCDVKNCRPLRHTNTVFRVVKARSAAGRIYEGGICWTWYNAVLGVVSALFGGPVLVMPYLIESDQLPTPGQGNMFPFIKKTEQERIEHTIISPMYVTQQRFWTILSNLSILANSASGKSEEQVKKSLIGMREDIEESWNARARLVDDLTGDQVEDAFLTKWTTGIPTAEQIIMMYNTAHLYIELLCRNSYSSEELQLRVSRIVSIFDKIRAAGEVLRRRFVLVPIFLCSILCPDMGERQHIIQSLSQAVGNEASWHRALEVSNHLYCMEMGHRDDSSKKHGPGTTKWSDVRDRLGGIALF